MTAEVVKTLENAYRDVRIAYAAEVVRYCDAHDIDFFALRDRVNARLQQQDAASSRPERGAQRRPARADASASAGIACRRTASCCGGARSKRSRPAAHSLILEARRINDESPGRDAARSPSAAVRSSSLGGAWRCSARPTASTPRTRAIRRRSCSRDC